MTEKGEISIGKTPPRAAANVAANVVTSRPLSSQAGIWPHLKFAPETVTK